MATVVGGSSAETLGGVGSEFDVIFGQGGADTLTGGAGQDTLAGGDGDDLIIGGPEADRLSGGNGNDIFRFATVIDLAGDVIGDARPGDRLELTFASDLTFIGSAAFSGAGSELRAEKITLNNGSAGLRLQTGDATLTLAGGVYIVPIGAGAFDVVDNQVINGTNAGETLGPTSGADTLQALGGDDVVRLGLAGGAALGMDGADTLIGGNGADYLNGGNGDDVATGGDGYDTLLGLDGADSLSGGAGGDSINGYAGADTLLGGSENDNLSGGSENDLLIGGSGRDTLGGNGGNDTLIAGDGASSVSGGEGDDRIQSGSGTDTLAGGAGNDRFVFATLDSVYSDRIVDFSQGDLVDLSAMSAFLRLAPDHFTGIAGEVLVTPGGIEIDMDGDRIADRSIRIQDPNDTASHVPLEPITAGNLVFRYGVPLYLSGTAGDDQIRGSNFDDSLSGLEGNDTLLGGLGADSLFGGTGSDKLVGGSGADLLRGGSGRDVIVVGSDDEVYGDGGIDRFIFDQVVSAFIADFNYGDRIDLSAIGGLVFIGTNEFTNSPGQVRQGHEYINIDYDGDGQADASIYYRDDEGAALTLVETSPGSLILEASRPVFAGSAGLDRFTVAVNPGLTSYAVNGNAVVFRDLAAGDVITLNFSGGVGTPTYRGSSGFSGNDPWQIVLREQTWVGETYVLKGLSINWDSSKTTDTLLDLGNFNGGLLVNIVSSSDGLQHAVTLTATGGAHRRVFGDGTDNLLLARAGGDTLLGVAGADTLLGASGADLLNGGMGNDMLSGGGGNDTLIGRAGADTLTGGQGPDLFFFNDADSRRGSNRDVISDFDAHDGDIIDLSSIDADPVTAGRQSFAFIGEARFSDSGQARYSGGVLQLEWTGDGRPDFEILFIGTPALPEAHLVL